MREREREKEQSGKEKGREGEAIRRSACVGYESEATRYVPVGERWTLFQKNRGKNCTVIPDAQRYEVRK